VFVSARIAIADDEPVRSGRTGGLRPSREIELRVPRRTYAGREIATVLIQGGFEPVGGRGSYRVFRYEHADTGEVRTVTVPITHAPVKRGTLREIADQAGAIDFDVFSEELDRRL
jgi:predicted RNA binding protein YcfA (HicA-like mRNA interferase family)